MEDVLVKMLVQAPSTAAVIAVVVVFIRYLGRKDEVWADLHKEHLEERRQTRIAVDRNTDALLSEAQSATRLADLIRDIKTICPYGRNPPQ